MVLAIAAYIQLGLLSGLRPDIATVFYAALAASSALAVVPLAILWFLDRRERETPWLFAAAFFWGAVIATALALPFNTAFAAAVDAWLMQHPLVAQTLGPDAREMIAAPISAPIVEELAKALGVVLLFWLLRAEFDNMRDGFVYGALVGVGFTWFESALYVAQSYAEFGVPSWGMQLGWRYALFGFGGHAMFTGIFGVFLGVAMQTRRRWLRILAPLFGLLVAIAAHFVNNALPLFFAIATAARGEPPPQQSETPPELGFVDAFLIGSVVELTIFLPFVVTMAIALWRSGVWERRVIREELAEEVGREVSRGEYEQILADGMFRTRRIDRLHPRDSAALVNAQHELAFRKRRVRDAGGDPERDRLVAGWRAEIARRRAAA
ncbi:MAG TPA: PrsW family intramembrane metalloprotease [Burkholderiales bacterium]|jgi:RsiW-degrading membrane proteinase PrsW (M82 family)|nr:PrsW family intramembrane metalloprotease [Burkholderiales bacterium]